MYYIAESTEMLMMMMMVIPELLWLMGWSLIGHARTTWNHIFFLCGALLLLLQTQYLSVFICCYPHHHYYHRHVMKSEKENPFEIMILRFLALSNACQMIYENSQDAC